MNKNKQNKTMKAKKTVGKYTFENFNMKSPKIKKTETTGDFSIIRNTTLLVLKKAEKGGNENPPIVKETDTNEKSVITEEVLALTKDGFFHIAFKFSETGKNLKWLNRDNEEISVKKMVGIAEG